MFPLALLLAASGPAQPQVPPRGPSQPLPFPMTLPGPHFPAVPGPAEPPKCALPDLADCLRACPPANDSAPFLRVPKVSEVEECHGLVGDGKCDPNTIWKHTWHAAARFRVPRFDLAGEPMEGGGLLIYEGMVLTVNRATGVYDLSFTATSPPTTVTIRLQLQFRRDTRNREEVIRLTIPPVRIDSDESAKSGDNSGRTIRIHHRGFSELFIETPLPGIRRSESTDLFAKPPVADGGGGPPWEDQLGAPAQQVTITKKWTIERVGTARFGSGRITNDDIDR